MSKELVSSIDLAAPPERVWEVLVDFAAFPAWNPFITQAEGRLHFGRPRDHVRGWGDDHGLPDHQPRRRRLHPGRLRSQDCGR
jgi:uncharacterized protein YndB with AHSA1/START domain